jgi:hypothetical protein
MRELNKQIDSEVPDLLQDEPTSVGPGKKFLEIKKYDGEQRKDVVTPQVNQVNCHSKDSYLTADMKAARKELKKMKNWLLKHLKRCDGFHQLIEITDSMTQWIGEMEQDGKLPYTTPDSFRSHMVLWEDLMRSRFELYSLLTSKASKERFLPEEISRIARAHINLTNMLLAIFQVDFVAVF